MAEGNSDLVALFLSSVSVSYIWFPASYFFYVDDDAPIRLVTVTLQGRQALPQGLITHHS